MRGKTGIQKLAGILEKAICPKIPRTITRATDAQQPTTTYLCCDGEGRFTSVMAMVGSLE
jgi:hypothetical protein